MGHGRHVPCGCNGCVGHDGSRPHFHCLACLGRAPDSCVHNDWKVNLVNKDLDEVLCAQPLVGSDGGGQGHDAGSACIGQVPGCVQVRVHIGHDHKAFLGKDFCCLHGLGIVRQQVFCVADDLYFHKVPASRCPGQACNAHSLICIPGTGGIGKKGHMPRYIVQYVCRPSFICPAQGQGDDLGICLLHGSSDQIQGILA